MYVEHGGLTYKRPDDRFSLATLTTQLEARVKTLLGNALRLNHCTLKSILSQICSKA